MSQTTNSTNKLATGNINRLMWEYTLPAILGTVVMSLYNIVDRIFIGQGVGALAISGLALTLPFSIVLMAFGMLIGAGSASRISITLGENKLHKAEKILGNAITLTFIMSGTAIILSMIFMNDILRLFGGTENTLQYAHEYMMIIIPGGIFTALYFGMNNILRASGHPKKAMQNIILGAVINTILDPIFIFIFDWGIQGAAWATVISYFIGTIHVGRQFFGKNATLRFYKENLKPEKDIILSIVSIGMSPFSMQIGTSLVVVFINGTLLKYGGDLAIGAYGIINSINMLIIMFIVGLNQGTQPIIGFNYGGGNYARMFSTLKKAIVVATMFSTFGFLVGMVFPRLAVALFSTDPEMIDISANAMRISVIMFPLIGIQIVISNFFQSIGKAKISIFLSLTRQFIFFIPALIVLPPIFKLNGAWASMPVSDGLAFFVSISTFILFYKKFKQSKMESGHIKPEIIEE